MEKFNTVTTTRTADCGADHELLIAKFRLKLKYGKPPDHSGMTSIKSLTII